MHYILVLAGDLAAVKFLEDMSRDEVRAYFIREGLEPGTTDDLLSCRECMTTDEWPFYPMVALASSVRMRGERCVSIIPLRGGDPYRILVAPSEGLKISETGIRCWEKGTWFVCKKA